MMMRYLKIVLVWVFLMECLGVAWAQDAGSVLGQQVTEAMRQARPGNRAHVAGVLTELAAAAEQEEALEVWAWAGPGAVEAWLDGQREDEEFNLSFDAQKILDTSIQRCEAQGVKGPLSYGYYVLGRYRFEKLHRTGAAAQAWERAGAYALDAQQTDLAVSYWLSAGRTYLSENQAAHVRECQSWLDLLVKQRGQELSLESQRLLANFRQRSQALLAHVFPSVDPTGAELNLQPFETSVVVSSVKQERGRARFVLANHQTRAAEGLLTLTAARGNVVQWVRTGGKLEILLGPTLQPKATQKKLRLMPGEQLKIYVEYHFAKSEAFTDQLQLDWTDGTASQVARAKFESSGTQPHLAQVTNISIANQSGAWPVPFYHEIFYRGEELSIEDVLVKASTVARVEIYNEDNGDLLAIDAEGDGIYNGPNDFLTRGYDQNFDTRPDVGVDGRNPVGSLEIFVFPKVLTGSTKLSVQLVDDGEVPRWREDAVDEQLSK